MANNRYVNTSFWKDNYISDLEPLEKAVFIYLLTNPRTNIAGIYEINIKEIAFDVGSDKNTIQNIMEKFEKDGKIIMDSGWVALLNFLKHQKLNPKTEISVRSIFVDLPTTLSTKLASSSTFLASSSKLLLCQQINKQDYEITPVENEPMDRITEPMDSLSHINRNRNKNINIIDTKVSMAKASELEKIKRQPSTEINSMFTQWEVVIGYKIESRMKQNRYACSNLLKKYGVSGLNKLIQGVAMSKEDQFAPSIADFCALQAKYNELVSWGHKRQKTSTERVATV